MDARIFVQKKPPFDSVRLRQLRHELSHLDIPQSEQTTFDALLQDAEIWLGYDIFNASERILELLKDRIIIDPVTDHEQTELPTSRAALAVELLPGQFDSRSAAAHQCLSLALDNTSIPHDLAITSAEIFLFDQQHWDSLSESTINSIKSALINPVETRQKNLSVLEHESASTPHNVAYHSDFTTLDSDARSAFIKAHGLAMNQDDLIAVQNYFRSEHREPTETEIKVLDTYWSDHCRHTTFFTAIDTATSADASDPVHLSWRRYLQLREQVGSQKPVSLMELGTIAAKAQKQLGQLTSLEESEEDNACSVIIHAPDTNGTPEPWLLMFKNETHNHPTEIDPFGGASTCIGGAIRDPLSGRAYVYQAMRLSGAGYQGTQTPLLPGKLPQHKICHDAAHGYSSYGNQIGLATTLVRELYHPQYLAKRLEVGVVIGGVKQAHVRRERPAAGDIVIMLGGKTGRDGIGGATGSSKTQTIDSVAALSAEVQKGNATEERKIQRLFRRPEFLSLIKKSNDFGAGGVSVAIGELADSLDVDLDVIPTKYEGLNGTELAISESQERMAIVIEAKDKDFALALANEENLIACHVATVTDSGYLRLYWQGEPIVNLSRAFLDTNGASRSATARLDTRTIALNQQPRTDISQDRWQQALMQLEHNSQQSLAESFDSSIGATTVLNPFGGQHQLSPEQVSAQTFMHHEGLTTLASFGFSPQLATQSPYQAGQMAVAESIAKVIAAGANPHQIWLSFQEYFARLGQDPDRWGIPMASLLGALDSQMGLGYAAIGGKDSMSGTYQDIDVPPTLISFAVGVAQTENVTSATLGTNESLYLLPCPLDDDQQNIDFHSYKNRLLSLSTQIQQRRVRSARVISDEGVAITLSQMAMGNQVGFSARHDTVDWFAPQYGSLIIAGDQDLTQHIDGLIALGETNYSEQVSINTAIMPITDLAPLNKVALNALYPEPAQEASTTSGLTQHPVSSEPTKQLAQQPSPALETSALTAPLVVMPIFPGTNCEYDTQAAFERAGARVQPVLIRNLDNASFAESAKAFQAALENAQILMLPGGFSLADEPDGAGKMIANFLRIDANAEAVNQLIDRDGLALGICNGFQALIKSGLLTHGQVVPRQSDEPTLTYNHIGRHVARIANIKVSNNHSPWLCHDAIDTQYKIPLSHGEGRLVANDKWLSQWQSNGQIATQYCDSSGAASMDYPANPNGSVLAIEGLTSPCGKVYGRMAHPERVIKDSSTLFKNIPNIQAHDIFSQGVSYFTGILPKAS